MSKADTPTTKKRRAVIADLPPGISVHLLGNGSYRVRIGKKFTRALAITKDFSLVEGPQGCRVWIAEQIRDRGALQEMKLTPQQLAQAKDAFHRLGDISLSDVVKYYFDSGPGGRKVTKIEDAIQIYRTHHEKAGSSEDYVKAQVISLNVLAETAGNLALARFTAEFLDKWFETTKVDRKWGDINTFNYVRDLKMFFRFCTGRNLIPRNPFDDHIFVWVKALRKRLKKRAEKVTVYTTQEAKQLLEAALGNPELDLLVWFGTIFFSGIRVDEMPKMTWPRFRWDEEIISLPREVVAKGGQPRHIEFTEAFTSWIKKIPGVEKKEGPLVSMRNWRHRIDKIHLIAKVAKKRNALRHTFASNYYVKTGDAKATREKLGQETDEVLFRHYISLIEKKDAEAFWALRPS